ncbi:Nudix family hydrolase [Methylobacillus gramineus]|uniref:Nudix family hydrolase n=1 Tax=Methylobacillus gramineus TaxID=755169 RepID=UPI001CFFDD33|nr:Nudix family hydrolase [Methylobacillus gramineus]MCB5186245.1 Nudix family hydrolase [Methylobacillus gramineus]
MKVVDAAVAVLQRDDGQVLLAERPAGKPWAGWWEFPGGKIEVGETPLHALKRELQEELGIEVTQAYPWLTRSFEYPDRHVRLHFFMVREWRNEPQGCEGQSLSWQSPAGLSVGPMLPANEPILAALNLPSVYAITNLQALGEARFFVGLQHALDNGLGLIQVREKHLDQGALEQFVSQVLEKCASYQARILLNGSVDMAKQLGTHGVHLASERLWALEAKPAGLLCAASCHQQKDLEKAGQLELDFAVLSPVQNTLSHPGAAILGWEGFAHEVSGNSLPVYALGGMQLSDLEQAWSHGAHGLAMQRAVWSV